MSESIKKLLEGNARYVEESLKLDPEVFKKLSEGQSPEFLWIGCADSRIPATQVTGTDPGAIFVHRNIANMVIYTDSNMLSVVYYAVKVLKVKHIIVCGHYGCGGVKAALSNTSFGYIDTWINHIKDVYRLHANELQSISDPAKRERRLIELNVIEQVNNLATIPFIQENWEQGEYPYIHGWVYDVADGKIEELECQINSQGDIREIFRFTNKFFHKS